MGIFLLHTLLFTLEALLQWRYSRTNGRPTSTVTLRDVSDNLLRASKEASIEPSDPERHNLAKIERTLLLVF